jgi:hypothetical protein
MNKAFPFPFFGEHAELVLFPASWEGPRADLVRSDLDEPWVRDAWNEWEYSLREFNIPAAAPGGSLEEKSQALVQQWAANVTATESVDTPTKEALAMVVEYVENVELFGFDDTDDRVLVFGLKIHGVVYFLSSEEPWVDPAGYWMD